MASQASQFEDADESVSTPPAAAQVAEPASEAKEQLYELSGEEYGYEEEEEDDMVYDTHDYGDFDDFSVVPTGGESSTEKTLLQPSELSLRKYYNKINVATLEPRSLSSSATSKLQSSKKKLMNESNRTSDKADRATTEQVLDPRTRMILFKMMTSGLFAEINGCVSTGKEANVYHAFTPDHEELAIKVYKTSILVFKDRDRYVDGEFRFRHGHTTSNPRKMVRLWAEKEMRNYNRLQVAGIPSPEPILLRQHVLVMRFLGKDGWAAPRLKDAEISEEKARELYTQVVKDMRILYQDCRLVHGDLSEYNLLYWKHMVYFIDVSQSVEHDHPRALEFLRSDCHNITEFFSKQGVGTMSMRELFDFVTDITIRKGDVDAYLDKMMQRIAARGTLSETQKLEEQVFRNAYIPRTLDGVIDFERDMKAVQQGETEGINYTKIIGMKKDLTGAQEAPAELEEEIILLPEKTKKEKKGKKKSKHAESDGEEREETEQAVAVVEENKQTEGGEVETTLPKTKENSEKKNKKKEGGVNVEKGEKGEGEEEGSGEEGSEGEGNSEDESEGESGEEGETVDAKKLRKENKKKVKAEQREKRLHKTPKKVKKRKEKVGKTKKVRATPNQVRPTYYLFFCFLAR
eukprot:comp21887_c0_seq1/m.31347 comp21887_c0_seq1/g.31347  ORF comp21887_c0_seq1/g.31347 comp21887_c0_seq1/m.31347 type:complete len:632 (-) comp21887_c0_seq1:489-2384(-)